MDRPGATIERVGGYRVVRRLATGGTADVLLAKAEGPHGFERTVVLKLLLSQYRNDQDFARMFAREAAAYARLSHPSIVQLYDFFALEGQLVMVLEYVDGPPLSRLRGMLKAVGQQLDDQASFHVAMRIFGALAAAHAACDGAGDPAPVIHRDVNPSNVLATWDGHVKLADFGVAKVSGLSGESRVGVLKGTFGYMAPEQIAGTTVTPRADVYAGAVILWELLTRRRAFLRGALPEVEVLRQMAEPKIVPLDVLRPDVDRGVRDAIRRALEPDAAKRRITAEEVVAILRAAVAVDPGRAHLARALAAVRHEPRASFTSVPPADVESPTLGGAKAPRPSAAARAEIALRRTPTLPPKITRVDARASQVPPTAPFPNSRPEVRLLDTRVEPPELLDATERYTRVEAPELVDVTERDTEQRRLPTAAETPAHGGAVRAEIDGILRDIPSSLPPATFRDGAERSRLERDGDAADGAPDAEAEATARTVLMVGAPQRPLRAPPQLQSAATQHAFPPPPPPPPFQGTTAPMPVVAPAAHTRPVAPDPRPASMRPRPMPVSPPAASPAPTVSSLSGAASMSDAHVDLDVPRRRGPGLGSAAALGVLVLAGGAGAMGYMTWHGAKGSVSSGSVAGSGSGSVAGSGSGSGSAPGSASAPASVSSRAAAARGRPDLPSGVGLLRTAGAAPGHRIYVDGVVVGQTPDDVKVRCGGHVVKVGSSATARQVQVPCGGETHL